MNTQIEEDAMKNDGWSLRNKTSYIIWEKGGRERLRYSSVVGYKARYM